MRSATLGVLHIGFLSVLLVSSISHQAPFFFVCVICLIATLMAYLRFQDLVWHHSADNELTFWLTFSTTAALIGLFASDASPCAFNHIGAPGILGAVGYVAIVVLEKSRNDRQRLHSFRRSASRAGRSCESLSAMELIEARASATHVEELCEKLDLFAPSGRSLWFWGSGFGQDEASVERLLTQNTLAGEGGATALDYLLTHVNLARVLRVLRRRRNRLLDALTAAETLAAMSPEAKAAIIDAIQKSGLRAFGLEEGTTWVTRVLLSVSSHAELDRLRRLQDSSGTYQSLHKLVFRDLREQARSRVLAHIALLCLHETTTCNRESAASSLRRLKIVADIDDTVSCSGGSFPAGVDRRFPKRCIYPGILELFRRLHSDAGSDGAGDLALLSARPHTYKDLTEQLAYTYFASLRRAGLLHATPTLLTGDLTSSLQIVTKAGAPASAFEAVALKKFENFTEYAALYPDFEYVFFGDNGQGDVRTAERMLAEHSRVRLALIHVVCPLEKTYGWRGEGQAEQWQALGIRFYHTAAGAARHLHDAQLLSAESLRAVCALTAAQLDALRSRLEATGQLKQSLAEFADDLRSVNAVLGEDVVESLVAECTASPVGHERSARLTANVDPPRGDSGDGVSLSAHSELPRLPG